MARAAPRAEDAGERMEIRLTSFLLKIAILSSNTLKRVSLTALSGHQKHHNLADKQEYSSPLPVVLTRQFLARSVQKLGIKWPRILFIG